MKVLLRVDLIDNFTGAVERNDVDGVLQFLKSGVDSCMADSKGRVSLVMAVNCDYVEMANILLTHGAGKRLGSSLYGLASSTRMIDVLLSHRLDINEIYDGGRNCLHDAIIHSDQVVAYLIAKGAGPNVRSDYGFTPLEEALTFDMADACCALLDGGAKLGKIASNERSMKKLTHLLEVSGYGADCIARLLGESRST